MEYSLAVQETAKVLQQAGITCGIKQSGIPSRHTERFNIRGR